MFLEYKENIGTKYLFSFIYGKGFVFLVITPMFLSPIESTAPLVSRRNPKSTGVFFSRIAFLTISQAYVSFSTSSSFTLLLILEIYRSMCTFKNIGFFFKCGDECAG